MTSIDLINRPFFQKKINISINIFKTLLIGYTLIYGFIEALEVEKKYGEKAPNSKLYGAYQINHFTINGDTILNYNDEKFWKSITVDRKGSLSVRNFYGDEVTHFRFEEDSLTKNRIKLTDFYEEEESIDFRFMRIDSTGLEFNFILNGDTIHGKSKKFSKEDFLLKNRDFNWISEYPFNR